MVKGIAMPVDEELEKMYMETRKAMRLTDKEIEKMFRKTRKSFKIV